MKLNREIVEMKFKIFFSVVICSAMFLPSINSQYRTYYYYPYELQQQQHVNQQQQHVNQQQQHVNLQQQHVNQQQSHNINQPNQRTANQRLQPNVNQHQQTYLQQSQPRDNQHQQPNVNRQQYTNVNQGSQPRANQQQHTIVNQQSQPRGNQQQQPIVNRQQHTNLNRESQPSGNQQHTNVNQQQHRNVNQQSQSRGNQEQQSNSNQQPKNNNPQQEYLYCGYTIAAMIDDNLLKVAREIEKYIKQAPSFRRNFSPIAASDYHTTIYTIYQCQPLPAQECANANGRMISNKCWLPERYYEDQNNKATCFIESYLNQPLYIKYASLNIGASTISLTLDIEEESWNKIRYAREIWENSYYNRGMSSQARNKQLYIELAYGRRGSVAINDLNRLNELVRPFNGAKLKLPSVYLRDDKRRPYQKKVDCRTYTV